MRAALLLLVALLAGAASAQMSALRLNFPGPGGGGGQPGSECMSHSSKCKCMMDRKNDCVWCTAPFPGLPAGCQSKSSAGWIPMLTCTKPGKRDHRKMGGGAMPGAQGMMAGMQQMDGLMAGAQHMHGMMQGIHGMVEGMVEGVKGMVRGVGGMMSADKPEEPVVKAVS